MGWSSITYSAPVHLLAPEREALLRYRFLDRQSKSQKLTAGLNRNILEVEKYHAKIKQICSVHQDCSQVTDWTKLVNSCAPQAPKPTTAQQTIARFKLESYKPSLADSIFGLVNSKQALLKQELDEAIQKDKEKYQRIKLDYAQKYDQWLALKILAKNILSGHISSFNAALYVFKPFEELKELGSRILVNFIKNNRAHINFLANNNLVIPSHTKSISCEEKLIINPIPSAYYFELCHIYLAAAVLRIAREIFALFSLEKILITGREHATAPPIISLIVSKLSLEKIRFDSISAPEALGYLEPRINFSSTEGFLPVESLFLT